MGWASDESHVVLRQGQERCVLFKSSRQAPGHTQPLFNGYWQLFPEGASWSTPTIVWESRSVPLLACVKAQRFFFSSFFFPTWSCFALNHWEFQRFLCAKCVHESMLCISRSPSLLSFLRLLEQMWTAFCESLRRIVYCEFNFCWTQCKLINSTVPFIEHTTVTVIVGTL